MMMHHEQLSLLLIILQMLLPKVLLLLKHGQLKPQRKKLLRQNKLTLPSSKLVAKKKKALNVDLAAVAMHHLHQKLASYHAKKVLMMMAACVDALFAHLLHVPKKSKNSFYRGEMSEWSKEHDWKSCMS